MASNLPEQMDRIEQDIRQRRLQIAKDYEQYKVTMDDNDEDRGNWIALGTAIQEYNSGWEQTRPVSRTGDTNAAVATYDKLCDSKYQQIKAITDRMVAYNNRVGAKVGTDSITASTHSLWLTRLITLLALAAGIALAWFMTTTTNSVLREATLALSEGSEQVVTAAGEVSSASQTLAQGASQQAASLEETSAAANEINSMAQQNTRNSQNTAEMVSKSQQSFEQTNRLLDELLHAMSGIEDSSKKISKIIKVIETIAFQTNILALNAAVEAARAGETGMGFAVVAEEVRNLAQRSAQAATDTASLIEESIQKSTGGKVNVDRVAQAIRGLTQDSGQIRILVDEIYLGSSEQAKGLDQIGRAIAQIEQVTQGTAASSEESAAAAEQLTAQAGSMQESVARLRELVDGSEGRNTSRPASARQTRRLGAPHYGQG
jgi:methyl-accepting chemotaxis protein